MNEGRVKVDILFITAWLRVPMRRSSLICQTISNGILLPMLQLRK
jgi:hypothetical protein